MARKTKKLRQRSTFIIITNGRESERNYFKILRGVRHSVYDIKVEFENAAPIGLVTRAIREKHLSNQVWVVFDKDEFPSDAINEAIHVAHQNEIGVALSNAAFEVWLINHFGEFSIEKTPSELIQILDVVLKKHGYTAGYSKNDLNVIKEVFLTRLDDALHNADVALQRRVVEYNRVHPDVQSPPYWDWNSCTTVHKLVEAMKLEVR